MNHQAVSTTMKNMAKRFSPFRKTILAGFMAAAMALSMAGCNGKIYSALFEDPLSKYLPFLLGGRVTLTEIQVSPSVQSIPEGYQLQYHATGIYSNNTIVDLTELVVWSTDDLLTTITAGGLLSTGAGSAATITVTATTEDVSGTATLNLTAATLDHLSIMAAGDEIAIATGTSIQFRAIGIFSDYTTLDLTE